METPLRSQDSSEELYHKLEEHALGWAILNNMLHLIVLGYRVFGMIQFEVKFIKMNRLVKWLAYLTILHSCYLTAKFVLFAIVSYIFNNSLSHVNLSIEQLNCSISENLIYLTDIKRLENHTDHNMKPTIFIRGGSTDLSRYQTSVSNLIIQASCVEQYIGPYKLLGHMVTVLYGFNAIAIFIMSALFPIELYYARVGFNYIRFVLSDTNVMRELYEKKQDILDRLDVMSRNQIHSYLNFSMKKTINQRDLRYLNLPQNKESFLKTRKFLNYFTSNPTNRSPSKTGVIFRRFPTIPVEGIKPVKSIRHSTKLNHKDGVSYEVKVGHENLKTFKPHIRSEAWFKASMLVYPIFMVYIFTCIFLIIASVVNYFDDALKARVVTCPNRADYLENWTFLDDLTYFETHYTVFLLSFGATFYCSYFFGTMFELFVWIQEISQQLNLCTIINQLSLHSLVRPPIVHSARRPTLVTRSKSEDDPLIIPMFEYHSISIQDTERDHNVFGGIKSFWTYVCFINKKQSTRLCKRELIAFKLMSKKQTVMRASYLNLNLFLSELQDTRFMITTILRRTTELSLGFALLVSLTKSQFASNYVNLSMMLGIALTTLNLELLIAAWINSSINKLSPMIHSIICASIKAGTDLDLLEFWLRHIKSHGLDGDESSYRILGYKVSWGSILSFNGAVSSAYLYSLQLYN